MAGIFTGALRTGREDDFGSSGVAATIGFTTEGLISALGFSSKGGRMSVAGFGFATRFALTAAFTFALGLAGVFLRSNKSSTPISGCESGDGSAGGSFLDARSVKDFGCGFITALAAASDFKPSKEMILPAAFALGGNLISSNGDLGADFAVAEAFFGTAGSAADFAGETGWETVTGLAFTLRLTFPVGFNFRTRAGFTAFDTVLIVFAAVFLRVFAVFAPVFVRLRVDRAESGLAIVVFFGFFMTTILALGARSLFEIKPGISEAQRLFNFSQFIDAAPEFYVSFSVDFLQAHSHITAAICLPRGFSELNCEVARAIYGSFQFT